MSFKEHVVKQTVGRVVTEMEVSVWIHVSREKMAMTGQRTVYCAG